MISNHFPRFFNCGWLWLSLYPDYPYLTNIFAGYCICGVPVPGGFSDWFWPAKFLLLRCSQLRFLVHYSVPCRPFSVRFTSANFSCLDRVRHTDRTFRRVCALTVPPLSCACSFFFLPSRLSKWYPVFPILGL